MKKRYETPVVTVIKWVSEDIITTSGGLTANSDISLGIDTQDTGIKSVSYDSIS